MFRILIILALVPFYNGNEVTAQNHNSAYIYGTITTDSDEQYTGFMRWGKEEMYWFDIFNAEKSEQYKTPKKDKKSNGLLDIDWSFEGIWKDKYCSSCNVNHVFACMFGEIAQLKPLRGDRAELTFKNGSTIIVDDSNTNDLGHTIQMIDYELGKIKFDWDDISLINFFAAPDIAEVPYGSALYGTVKTERRKRFTGYIQWDMDERSGVDILDGDTKYGDQKIPFEKIASIEKIQSGDAVTVTFESGRSLDLDGSNDCDDGNRGIGIYSPEIGTIEVEWELFDHVQFKPAPMLDIGYDDFGDARNLEVEVHTFDEEAFNGTIAFDMDELWDFELLDGDDDDIKIKIPFRNIANIVPKNRDYSMITLINGEQLLLGDRQDVSRNNNGILLFTDSSDLPIEIEWDDIEEIVFK